MGNYYIIETIGGNIIVSEGITSLVSHPQSGIVTACTKLTYLATSWHLDVNAHEYV